MSLLQVHHFDSLLKVTFSAVLNLIQPNIACEGCCAKEFARPGKSKVMILEAYSSIVFSVDSLTMVGASMKLYLLCNIRKVFAKYAIT